MLKYLLFLTYDLFNSFIANRLLEVMELKRKWEEDKAKVEEPKAFKRAELLACSHFGTSSTCYVSHFGCTAEKDQLTNSLSGSLLLRHSDVAVSEQSKGFKCFECIQRG